MLVLVETLGHYEVGPPVLEPGNIYRGSFGRGEHRGVCQGRRELPLALARETGVSTPSGIGPLNFSR